MFTLKNIAILLFFLLLQNNGRTEELQKQIVVKIVDSIYQIENSKKYPYGIKSIPLKGETQLEREEYARKICQNTVVNQYQRWIKAGRTNKFMESLGARYCPLSDKSDTQKLNKNWISNLRKVSGLDF